MADDDQYSSMRSAAYTNVLQAAVTLRATQAMHDPQETTSLVALEQAIEAARLYAPEPLEKALLAVLQDARRWVRVTTANAEGSTAVKEAEAILDQDLSQARMLMRDDARPAQTVRYADDSTMLARLRIAYARQRPLSQQEKALTVGWPQILTSSVIELIVGVILWTIWFKAAVWVIGTYWWTGLPTLGWLPAAGLALIAKLLFVKTGRPTEPFALPAQRS